MREKQDYRNNLEAIMQTFPDSPTLTVNQVAQYLNVRRQTASDLIKDGKLVGTDVSKPNSKHKIYRVTPQSLARFLS